MNAKMKTTFPDDVMNRISDLVEKELIQKDIFYIREGTVFRVPHPYMGVLLDAQANANLKLIDEGIVTKEMISREVGYVKRFIDENERN
jgi:hypothetical protein